MYSVIDFKSKKAFSEAVEDGEEVKLFAYGFGTPNRNGLEYVEGPHYPKPHRWHAEVQVKDGIVTNVK